MLSRVSPLEDGAWWVEGHVGAGPCSRSPHFSDLRARLDPGQMQLIEQSASLLIVASCY